MAPRLKIKKKKTLFEKNDGVGEFLTKCALYLINNKKHNIYKYRQAKTEK